MVRKYQKSDYKEVESWFHKRDIPITEDYLPPTGFIVPGKAAGYIFRSDGNFCVFECFVGNPNCSKLERKIALQQIVAVMIQEAKQMGFKEVYGFATSKLMLEIGYAQGFEFIEKCDSIRRIL